MARPAKAVAFTAVPRGESGIDYGPLLDHLGYGVRRVQLLIFQDFIRSMEGLALRPAQYSLLLMMSRNPGLKQAQLGMALGIKSANLVALLDELVGRGFARRAAAPGDRRSYALHLTAKGEAILVEAISRAEAHERRLQRHIGESGRRDLIALLRALESGLDGAAGRQAEPGPRRRPPTRESKRAKS